MSPPRKRFGTEPGPTALFILGLSYPSSFCPGSALLPESPDSEAPWCPSEEDRL